MIIFMITSKFDNPIAQEWEHLTKDIVFPTTDNLKEFLKDKAVVLETTNFKQDSKQNKLYKIKNHAFTSSTLSCYFCKGQHSIYSCEVFLKLAIENRQKEIEKLNLCQNCLKPGHSAIKCASGGCRKCNKKHNSLLHRVRSSPEGKNESKQVALSSQFQEQIPCLLSTARVDVFNETGMMRTARVLLDSGSQSNFISENMVTELGLKVEKENICITGINNIETAIQGRCSIKLQSRYNSKYLKTIQCLVLPHITSITPQVEIDIKQLNIPKEYELADPSFYRRDEIDILLGSSIFWETIENGKRVLGKDKPILQQTKLGWIVAGEVVGLFLNLNKLQCNLSRTADAQTQLEKFWFIEELHDKIPKSEEEMFCENHFRHNFKRNEDGRFIVSIPLIKPESMLGESENIARKRFLNLERKLQSQPSYKQAYCNFMQEYINLNHMTKVQNISPEKSPYFLPHHGVFNEASITTKLRVVFDASCKTSSYYSLNDIQGVGPIIQNDLVNILIRFRQYKIAISADITKMYRQVLIDENQRHLQQILWRKDPSDPLDIYQLNTVTYGTASGSFLAIRCLNQLAYENVREYPNACETISNDFYVDDLLTGADDIDEATSLITQISNILEKGCFTLRKWISNNTQILGALDNQDSLSVLKLGVNESTKTLGLYWGPGQDTLLFNINISLENKITKRSILSIVGQIFDPLGLLGAHIIQAKLILQALWIENLGWDDEVCGSLCDQWISFCKELPLLNKIKISRPIRSIESNTFQLHGFADASERAYGACVYLLSHGQETNIIKLIISKSRVAPLKSQTIPHLELCAALLLAKLANLVEQSLRIEFKTVYLWSDSTIVLSWLKLSPHLLKVFVASRVKKIQDLTNKSIWRYVPSGENPADKLSRGISAKELINCDLWWSGPLFLKTQEECWPKNPIIYNDILPDLRTIPKIVLISIKVEDFSLRFSNILKAKRVIAYILRFANNSSKIKDKRREGALTASELHVALITLIKNTQVLHYPIEVKKLKNSQQVHSNSNILNLKPFLDENSILRVGGRLKHSKLTFAQKHPIILPPKAHLTRLILQYEHLKLGHAGPSQTLFSARERFWPIHGRKICKSILHQCIRCFRAKPTHNFPLMGDLPPARVSPSYPFATTGIDYAGPFLIKRHKGRGAKIDKAYLSIFVCFATKASHIEVISDLTTEAFIAALRRFVARRGKPNKIHSDNGTNFVGAQRELKAILNEIEPIYNYLANEGIHWQFIPPNAPHFGGLWENTIKRTKFHLKRILAGTSVTFEQLCTITCQVESILNSRPLSPLSNHPEDLEPLTPAHFLIGRKLSSVPDTDLQEAKVARLSHFQRMQQIVQNFWTRWSREYLPELQTRKKWKTDTMDTTAVGDLVLIRDDHHPPLCWPLGRIIQIHPGKDQRNRVVTLRTQRGILKRPVAKVFPLPKPDDNQHLDGQ